MKCIELHINGELVWRVGRDDVENYHVSIVQWGQQEKIEVTANGSTGYRAGRLETFSWGKRSVDVGDELLVRIVGGLVPDDPIKVEVHEDRELGDLEKLSDVWSARIRHRLEEDKPARSGKRALTCTFCGKTQYEVNKLIAGPGACICNECVGLCNQTLGEE